MTSIQRWRPVPHVAIPALIAFVASGLVSVAVMAATAAAPASSASDPASRYARERAACMNGQSKQDRPTCLREAEAARAEAAKGELGRGPTDYQRNQTQRCDALTGADQQACRARMSGQGSRSGNAADGGILREMTTPDTASGPAR